MTTVGIDIGSATSQLTVSRLELRRLDTRYVVSRRDVLHQSDVTLTPYLDSVTIDVESLGRFINAQYSLAGVSHDDVDSGAVILTGLALAKHNSRAIGDLFASQAGKLVAVSAGDALEATLASRGAGIERLSHREAMPILHIDIGGGTTKYAYVDGGEVRRVAAIDIGARLVLFDGDTVSRVEEPALKLAAAAGVDLSPGKRLDPADRDRLAARMAQEVLAHGLPGPVPGEPALLRTPALFAEHERPDPGAVTFSGGVSEYIYGRESALFGDLGKLLADAIRSQVAARGLVCVEPARGIRATVLGASQYSLQLSGNTVYASSASVLPLRNVPVVNPHLDLSPEDLDESAMSAALKGALAASSQSFETSIVAIALRWQGSATAARLGAICRALLESGRHDPAGAAPLVVVCDADIAGLLGRRVQELSGGTLPILCVDGIEVSDFDFLDVGEFVPGTAALPVVVKSLLFPGSSDPHLSRPDQGGQTTPSEET